MAFCLHLNYNYHMVREIHVREVKKLLDRGEDFLLIDVREPNEREITHIGGELIPMREVFHKVDKIPRNKMVVFYCRSGQRSAWVVEKLQQEYGFDNLYNMAGGLLAWSKEIDPQIPRY